MSRASQDISAFPAAADAPPPARIRAQALRDLAFRSFGVLISLINAINQVTYAFGPGVVGLLRDAAGSYALPFYGCIGLELIAAVLIMVRGRGERAG
jgi:hypothetical protein